MISNLPNIINTERKNKVGSPKSLYVSVGPITPMPGPILARHEREVDIPSIKVRLGSRYNVTREPIKKMIMNIKKKTPTLRKRFSSRTLSPILSLMMARGCITKTSSLLKAFNNSIIRTILIPPVVDPAQPPINIANNNTKTDIFGQSV